MIKHLKQSLFLIHKWTGFVMSLLFVVWFVSGFVMIYHSFPKPRPQHYFHDLSSFSGHELIASPHSLLKKHPKAKLTLEMLNEKPVYRLSGRKPVIYDAGSLQLLQALSETDCQAILKASFSSPIDQSEVLNDFDQWIPWSYYKAYFPIYKYKLDDKDKTHVYVSSTKGQIVQETTRQSRIYAWIGAIPHWMYFKSLRLNAQLWSDVVIWISAIGCLACLSGIIAGVIRIRRRKGKLELSPYKKPTLRWHHISGLIFGFFVFSFILSGLFSLADVPNWMVKREALNYYQLWNQQNAQDSTSSNAFAQVLNHANASSIRKITCNKTMGRTYYSVYTNHPNQPEYYCVQDDTISYLPKITEATIEKQLKTIVADKQYNISCLNEYNTHYSASKKRARPLPVYEVAFDDDYNTRLYIHHRTGELLKVVNNSTRVQWWLYQGLHTFKFGYLARFEGLRQSWLILISIGGTIVSLSAFLLFIRYLKRKARKEC